MNLDRLSAVLSGIVGVAAITAFVSSPHTRGIILAAGQAFSSSLSAALGNR